MEIKIDIQKNPLDSIHMIAETIKDLDVSKYYMVVSTGAAVFFAGSLVFTDDTSEMVTRSITFSKIGSILGMDVYTNPYLNFNCDTIEIKPY